MPDLENPAMTPEMDPKTVPRTEPDDDYETQDISAGNINPAKLTTLLRGKFGIGAYGIQVSHEPPKQRTVCGMEPIIVSIDDAQYLLYQSAKETFTCKPVFSALCSAEIDML